MVIGLLTITAIPTVTGIALGASEQRKQNSHKIDEKRMAKFFLDVFCEGDTPKATELHERRVVLRDNKVYLDYPHPSLRKVPAHTAQAFFVPYPDDNQKRGDGLVSTVSDNPPMLNWIYVDKDTLELKYGNKTQSIQHLVGPWDWTEDETGVILEKQERFAAVEEEDGSWGLYYDRNADGLAGVVAPEKAVVEIGLDRHFVEEPKEKENQT